jgi:lipid A disaccharide synthetase
VLKPRLVVESERRPEGLLHPEAAESMEKTEGPEGLLRPAERNSDKNEELLRSAAGDNEEKTSSRREETIAEYSKEQSRPANSLRSPSPEGEGWGQSSTGLIRNLPMICFTDNARATLMYARAAVVASGTATVEAALSGTPFIVIYRLAPLTWLLGRRLVKLDTFAMPNLISGKKIVPELIQKDFTAQNVLRELNAIIPDGPARQQMEADLKMVQQRLRDSQHADSPAQRAAREILAALKPA